MMPEATSLETQQSTELYAPKISNYNCYKIQNPPTPQITHIFRPKHAHPNLLLPKTPPSSMSVGTSQRQ